MKKYFTILFVLCFLSCATTNAVSPKTLAKKMGVPFSAQMGKKRPTPKTSAHVIRQDGGDESFQASFSEEPSEFHYKLSESLYRYILSFDPGLDDENYEKAIDLLFPKEMDLFLTWDETDESSQSLAVSRLRQPRETAVEAVANLLADFQGRCTENYDDHWSEEVLFTFTPLLEDKNGHYTSDVFYSCVDSWDQEFHWGKVVITSTNIYVASFYSSKNDAETSTQVSTFLSSLRTSEN